jgi:pyrimidine-nucleoside phosphorylase
MRMIDIITKKREGGRHDEAELAYLVSSYVRGEVPDYQVAAWLMAVYFKGMDAAEAACLTRLMRDSGKRIDLSGIPGPFVDKHSTGGVGDKTSLVIAPVAAACGLKVPMMSGRGLGHTGGTLDKLDSIPGYRSRLEPAEFRRVLERAGFAMTGQTPEVVPADRLLYALRDVTATVESIPLITASILSKKCAEGAEALVMDVKVGSGAFMKDLDSARALARSLVSTGRELGLKTFAVLSGMDRPLGRMAGNFLEVEEALDCLDGRGPADTTELSLRLAAWMLVAGGLEPGIDAALARCRAAIADGSAMRRFLDNVSAQGGDPEALLSMRGAYRAPLSRIVAAGASGWLDGPDAYAIGRAARVLGAGRERADQDVLPDAGVELLASPGERVERGQPLARLCGREEARLAEAEAIVADSYRISQGPIGPAPLVIEELEA